MKEIDVSNCELIHAGKAWEHDQDPCTKEMIGLLERAENYCYWFQPRGKGVEFQFPVMEVKGKFYLLSLRIQKAIFRHIRLNKEFKNIETIADGRQKLRIPKSLLEEKRKTSNRFSLSLCILMWQRNMKTKLNVMVAKDTKNNVTPPPPTVDQFILQTIVPFFASQQNKDTKTKVKEISNIPNIDKIDISLPEYTSFIFDEMESAVNMVTQLQQDCPSIMTNEETFIEAMKKIYKKLSSE